MLDPHTSMSLTAVLVLTVVVLVTVLGWLAAVFHAGRPPRAGSPRPVREAPVGVGGPEASGSAVGGADEPLAPATGEVG